MRQPPFENSCTGIYAAFSRRIPVPQTFLSLPVPFCLSLSASAFCVVFPRRRSGFPRLPFSPKTDVFFKILDAKPLKKPDFYKNRPENGLPESIKARKA